MMISVFELFSIGIGPSSSHTVGPMRAANEFICELQGEQQLTSIHRLAITLYGSLAFTGKGHGTDKAVVMGLIGEAPETIDPDSINRRIKNIEEKGQLILPNQYCIDFSIQNDIIFDYKQIFDFHPNGIEFTAYNKQGDLIRRSLYFSIGGGFIIKNGKKKFIRFKR